MIEYARRERKRAEKAEAELEEARRSATHFRQALETVQDRLKVPGDHHVYGNGGIHQRDCAGCGTLQFIDAVLDGRAHG